MKNLELDPYVPFALGYHHGVPSVIADIYVRRYPQIAQSWWKANYGLSSDSNWESTPLAKCMEHLAHPRKLDYFQIAGMSRSEVVNTTFPLPEDIEPYTKDEVTQLYGFLRDRNYLKVVVKE